LKSRLLAVIILALAVIVFIIPNASGFTISGAEGDNGPYYGVTDDTAALFVPYIHESVVAGREDVLPSPEDAMLAAYGQNYPGMALLRAQLDLEIAASDNSAQITALEASAVEIVGYIDEMLDIYADYTEQGNTAGQLSVRAAIERAKSDLAAQKLQYAALCLQRDLAAFSAERAARVLDERQRLLEYEFYGQYSLLPVHEDMDAYYEAAIEELEETLTEVEARQEKGLSTYLDIERVRADLDTARAERSILRVSRRGLDEKIRQYTGLARVPDVIPLNTLAAPKARDVYLDAFLSGNTAKDARSAQIAAYKRYIEYLTDEPAADTAQAERELLVAELTLARYEMETPLYVADLLARYENCRYQLESIDAEIVYARADRQVTRQLFDTGYATKAQTLQKETAVAKLRYERQSLVQQATLLLYILDNAIEGQ
jgi:outer membrane protein TolC